MTDQISNTDYHEDDLLYYENGPMSYYKVVEKAFLSLASVYWNSRKDVDQDKQEELEEKYSELTYKDIKRDLIKKTPTVDLIYLNSRFHTNYWITPILFVSNSLYIYMTYKIFKKFGRKVPMYFNIQKKSIGNLFKYGKVIRSRDGNSSQRHLLPAARTYIVAI